VKAWLNHAKPLVIAVAAAALFASCDEQLDSGMACPVLCPPATAVRDTTILAVAMDTSLGNFPPLGAELRFFIATLGDTLETWGVIRYDSLPGTFRFANAAEDVPIVEVDTGSVLKLRLSTNDTLGGPVTVELYDVDLGGPDDTDPAIAANAFIPERMISSQTFEAASLKDSLRVPVPPSWLLSKILTRPPDNRARIGVRVAPTGQARLLAFTSNAGGAPLLEFRPSPDDTVALVTMGPRSKFPAEPFVAEDLADYLIVAKAPPDPPFDVLRVGGMPPRRAYLRFDIPSSILDSASIVRATLLLTQRPSPFSPDSRDTVSLQQFAVTAGPSVTDISRALFFLSICAICRGDSVHFVPADSGVRAIEMIGLVRSWRSTNPNRTVRAMALRSAREGEDGRHADFFSIEAPFDVRPRLRLTYVPKQQPGIP
jgi:hypothetical protein